ncbi:hypothetical protein HMPREF9104_01113 [Lentilactobacillus kisonensis F0435]|uniref:Uncharacterized protein n=1 Tax=Lentilactobacillus kisonensis F0435 TaxID=797516 RepID=H1LET7_9LACO|nr:hypothetical protein HMPREF9104_01113 [Lentilactobacillus kisonensis F0435]
MFFNRWKHRNVKAEYDERLLALINNLKEEWDHAAQTQNAVADSDIEIWNRKRLWHAKNIFSYIKKLGFEKLRMTKFNHPSLAMIVMNSNS